MYPDGSGKDSPQPFRITPSQFISKIALRRRSHAVAQEGEHRHHSPDDIVDTVVVDSEHIKNNPGGVQRHPQDENHSYIQKDCISRNSPVVCNLCLRHDAKITKLSQKPQGGALCRAGQA